MNVDPTAESGPDGEQRRELRRQCSNYIARRIQRLSSRLSTPEKGTSHHHVSVFSCLRYAYSNDPPLACRHRDGCCDGSVPLPEDPRRWRAHRHSCKQVFASFFAPVSMIAPSTSQMTTIISRHTHSDTVRFLPFLLRVHLLTNVQLLLGNEYREIERSMRSRTPLVSSSSPMSSESEELDVPSDAELLYDPASDDRDARWMGKMRKGRSSDAILSCPCCFVTLCVDCQHHDSQHNRYRAMFVMNCKVTHLTLCCHISPILRS